MLTRMLWQSAQANPAKAAIVQGEQRISYDQLYTRVGHVSGGLRSLGVEVSDCVAMVLPNCPEFIISLFACARLGAVLLPLNPTYTRDELQRFIADGQAKLLITDAQRAPLCQDVIAEIGRDIRLIVIDGVVEGAAPFDALLHHATPVTPSETYDGRMFYLYTSGSTGEYKRMCCTQKNLFYEAYNFVETIHLTADDNILCTIPLYHSYGLGNCLLDAAYTGSTLVLLEPVIDNGVSIDTPFVSRTQRVLDLMRQEDIRFFPGVPYQFETLAALPDDVEADLSRLKWCISSGDVLPERTFNRFRARFGLPIRSLYGSTEAGSICMNTDLAPEVEFGSLGRPLENVDIQIRDANGRACPPHQDGNIWVKSPVIPPSGYENRPELNATAFQDGYYDTGDMGNKDTQGHLVMTGRKQTFVDVGGYKVDIGEVEEVLHQHPRVREAAALGVERPYIGEVIKAVIVPQGMCQEDDILAYCRDHLAAFKIPRLIEFRDELPRSPIGKVLKGELQENASDVTSPTAAAPLSAVLASLSDQVREQQAELLASHLQEQVAATLQIDTSEVPRSVSFRSLGFDSIRAAELHSRLIQLTGLQLSITMLWNYPTIEALAEVLVQQIQPRAATAQEPPVATVTEPPPLAKTNLDDIFSEIDTLSDDEVEAFFQRPPQRNT